MQFRRRVIPILLLRGSGLFKGRRFRNHKYIGDPINTVRIFNDKEVDELILLDIDASYKNTEPNFNLLEQIASECFVPLTYGGGVNSLEKAQKIISIGFERIVVNSASYTNPYLIKNLVESLGSSSIIGCIDYKNNLFGQNKLYIKSARNKIRNTLTQRILELNDDGVGEIIVNCIDRDGEMNGYDIPLLKNISDIVSVPVIASGGAGSLNDIKELFNSTNVSAASAGSLFCLQGKHRAVLITYPSEEELKRLTLI